MLKQKQQMLWRLHLFIQLLLIIFIYTFTLFNFTANANFIKSFKNNNYKNSFKNSFDKLNYSKQLNYIASTLSANVNTEIMQRNLLFFTIDCKMYVKI